MLSRCCSESKRWSRMALNVDANQTTQSMAKFGRCEDALWKKLGKPRKRGPMGQAFFTRNPLLPREYFVPKGVDTFVAKMNEGVEHSLLDCPGRQTIQVATFRGKTFLQTSAQEDDRPPANRSGGVKRSTIAIHWSKPPRMPIC